MPKQSQPSEPAVEQAPAVQPEAVVPAPKEEDAKPAVVEADKPVAQSSIPTYRIVDGWEK